jgi:hypothetical protein
MQMRMLNGRQQPHREHKHVQHSLSAQFETQSVNNFIVGVFVHVMDVRV